MHCDAPLNFPIVCLECYRRNSDAIIIAKL